MLAFWDKKKQMGAMVMKRKRHGDGTAPEMAPMKNEEVKTEDGEVDGKHLAAQDMLMAIHSKSADQLRHAMENFMTIHSSNPEAEPKAKE